MWGWGWEDKERRLEPTACSGGQRLCLVDQKNKDGGHTWIDSLLTRRFYSVAISLREVLLVCTSVRAMLKSRTFVKKTRRGGILKIVREHYLRDDVWCGLVRCSVCEQGDGGLLDGAPESVSEICPFSHYLVPDTNVVLHQVRLLELTAVSFAIRSGSGGF